MLQSLTRKPFKDRLKDTGFLLKNSFTIIGKDADIKTPTIHMIIYSVIVITLIYASISMFFFPSTLLAGVGLLFFTLLILTPMKTFYDIRQKADQSWIVYNTLSGKDISYVDAHKHTARDKGNLTLIAFLDILIKYIGSQRSQKKGIFSIIINLFLAALLEIWDLLSHYMLPAVVIEEKSIKQIVPEIKALRNNVPATLTGVFGIDFVGNVIGVIIFPVYFLFIVLSIGVGYLMSLFTDFTVISLNLSGGGVFSFSWVPIVAILYIVSIASAIIGRLVESVKVIYFTIFYTSLTRPMVIIPSIRNEITNFLLMKKSDFSSKNQQSTQRQQYINQLANYMQQYIKSGYSQQQIIQFLLSKGYAQADINAALSQVSQSK